MHPPPQLAAPSETKKKKNNEVYFLMRLQKKSFFFFFFKQQHPIFIYDGRSLGSIISLKCLLLPPEPSSGPHVRPFLLLMMAMMMMMWSTIIIGMFQENDIKQTDQKSRSEG